MKYQSPIQSDLPSSSCSARVQSKLESRPSDSSDNIEQIPLAQLLSRVRPPAQTSIEPISFGNRVRLFAKGIPMFGLLVLGASLYWLMYIWDVKHLEKRTRHYRLKLRNTFMSYFRPDTVSSWEVWRRSECAHCGACCEILWRCPFLKENDEGVSSCSVHDKRPITCRTFPVDPWSVDMISEETRPCSYEFIHTTSSSANVDSSTSASISSL